jgi:flagellar L-ring protein precursor FlgH
MEHAMNVLLTLVTHPLRLLAAAVAATLLCGGCVSMPQPPKVDVVEATPRHAEQIAARPPLPNTGSLFSPARYRPGFEDVRARLVGDSLTIQITENVSASQQSTSTIDRAAKNDSAITAFPFLSAAQVGKVGLGTSSDNSFSGKGGTQSANTFTGTITATVIQVLPNGHLMVAGDKQIGVNHNVDVMRFSGVVDPQFIQAGNVVASTQVANARIESRGRGQQDEAQAMSWLSRFFMNVMPF